MPVQCWIFNTQHSCGYVHCFATVLPFQGMLYYAGPVMPACACAHTLWQKLLAGQLTMLLLPLSFLHVFMLTSSHAAI